jgi:hypothetical protein
MSPLKKIPVPSSIYCNATENSRKRKRNNLIKAGERRFRKSKIPLSIQT